MTHKESKAIGNANRPESADVQTSESWLMEEYRLLSQHYFHEDNQLQKIIMIYGTLNSGLLAFTGSQFATHSDATTIAIPAVGMILCIAWFATLFRIREWRNYIERRIRTIEEGLHPRWEGLDLLPLDIRTMCKWSAWGPQNRWFNKPYLLLRNFPSSVIYLVLPNAFFVIWAFLLVLGL